ncbi:transcriptional regulator ClgR [Paractinoplanes deccanensis]|uniref:Transcriptional regulator ClgR n=1 Tax=Paractinoplanes deccanensis TaxID=113561 RepID=A0ABQ3YKI9_9ACTN|nr:transcriptional regulator ClgR [Actinoplanes deccanensis]
MLRKLIGQVLRRTRMAQGKTLRDVSDLAGVSIGHLSEVERGRKEPSSELLDAICRALGLTLFDLLLAVLREAQQQPQRIDLRQGRFELADPARRLRQQPTRRGDFQLAA